MSGQGVKIVGDGAPADNNIQGHNGRLWFDRTQSPYQGWVFDPLHGWQEFGGGGGGGGSPGAPDKSVQTNQGGVFTGSPFFTFDAVLGHAALGKNAIIDGAVAPAYYAGYAMPSILTLQQNYSGDLAPAVAGGGFYNAINDNSTFTHTGTDPIDVQGYSTDFVITDTSTGPYSYVVGGFFAPTNYGSGDISTFDGVDGFVQHFGSGTVDLLRAGYFVAYNQGTGHANEAAGVYGGIRQSSGTTDSAAAIYADNFGVGWSVGVTDFTGVLIEDFSISDATNPRNLWSKGSGFNDFEGMVRVGNSGIQALFGATDIGNATTPFGQIFSAEIRGGVNHSGNAPALNLWGGISTSGGSGGDLGLHAGRGDGAHNTGNVIIGMDDGSGDALGHILIQTTSGVRAIPTADPHILNAVFCDGVPPAGGAATLSISGGP